MTDQDLASKHMAEMIELTSGSHTQSDINELLGKQAMEMNNNSLPSFMNPSGDVSSLISQVIRKSDIDPLLYATEELLEPKRVEDAIVLAIHKMNQSTKKSRYRSLVITHLETAEAFIAKALAEEGK